MKKQLRIWLFVLLGTLLTSTALPAEGVITMTIAKRIGDNIKIKIEANGSLSIGGASWLYNSEVSGYSYGVYELHSQTITIRGNVTLLYCSSNQLTSLDVSQNTALTKLDCGSNQLTSLDVSGCTDLQRLECRSNQLTSLDVSGCTSLTTLDCRSNKLTSLNVSGCTALTTLDCSYNRLTSLDVSGCTSLTTLDCRGNQLFSLNVSGCTALTTFDFLKYLKSTLRRLNVAGCTSLTSLNFNETHVSDSGWGLISLDVSGCTSLTALGCKNNALLTSLNVSGCTALRWLECQNNRLTSLDLSGCTALTKLDCSSNPLTSINLSGCQSLKSFSWTSGNLTSLNVSGCTALTTLVCYWNQLTSLDLSSCTALTTLVCYRNQLTSLDVSQNTALTKLDCGSNQLTSLDVSGCTSLTELECYSNQLTSLDVSKNSSLGRLKCQRNQLTSLNISSNTPVAYLDCENNQLTSLDLSRNTFLTKLLCANNHLTSLDLTGCTSLKTFSSPSGLTSLNLSGCTGLTELYCPEDNSLTSLNVLACINLEKIRCVNSGLDGKAMSRVISDLPDRNGKIQGTIEMKFEYAKSDKTFAYQYDVEVAKTKNWRMYYHSPDFSGDRDYIGAPNPICSVTKSVEGKGSLSITGADNLDVVVYGTRLTISATPAPKYELVSLTANGVDISSTKSFVVKDTVTIKAVFGGLPFNVVLEQEGEGELSVTGVDNLDEVPYGTELTIIANPKKGYELTSLIANGINITDTKKVTVRGDLTIKATFTKKNFAVTFVKEGDGTVTAAGATSLDAVAYGTELTIVATPAEGYELQSLVAGGVDITATKKVVVEGNLTVKATFAKKNFAVTFEKVGEGTITATGATSLDAVAYGTELTIVATPAEGYELVSITANGTDITASKKVVVTGNLTVKATFTKKSFAVSLTKEGEGTITATGASNLNSVAYGTELTINATPADGYELTALTAGGTDITASKKVVVTGNLTVKATFTKKSFAVTLTKEGEGTISATGASNLNSVAYGTELTIVATPAEGYELTALTANGTDILATKKVVVEGNLTVKATFEKKTFAVTLTSNEHGDITIVEPVSLKAVPYGTTLTVKATGKNAQCVLTELTANGEDILASQSFVVTGVTEVKATFVDHTGVETTVTQQVKLYPNPATDYVIVEGVAPASEVTLHSMTGERLYAGRADDRGTLQIDLTPYADGVYLVCVAGDTYRVVVRH